MTRLIATLPALALTMALTLAGQPGNAQEEPRTISGSLSYMQKIALPDDASVTVAATGAFGTILGEVQFGTEGRQVPIPFSLDVPAKLSGRVGAVIRIAGQPRWLVEDVPFKAGDEAVDLGALRLSQVTPLAFATRYDCGGSEVEFGVLGERAILRVDGRDIEMEQVRAASGARFEAVGNSSTEFWSKGDAGMLTVEGQEMPDCTRIDESAQPYRAGGNEPGWQVSIGENEVELIADYGELKRSALRPEPEVTPGAYLFDMQGIGARLTLEDRLCRDDATGMPHPHHAALALDERVLRGCGGDPASLLTGGEWQIEDMGGAGIVDRSAPAISFDAGGRVAGTSGCNRFIGGYELTGEGLSFSQMGATLMACPDALMKQERRLLDALEQVRRFDFDETGALLLIGGPEDATLLKARRMM
ncbi:heat shock protein HslJ [Roseovarius halotolerans]|uniref:META domain protein n=1 Tax=Roseovarius halotolerans TaxID=505353 RepID=A0A1X6ZUE9_9RHOB|nr:META domain-containing protein [Roseovarius halotolerans]RKT27783.1 heat shock protein HslJ [Roseovarius halotolerans]SLN61468.1 META domain protein [Roseovarius halotolerans]